MEFILKGFYPDVKRLIHQKENLFRRITLANPRALPCPLRLSKERPTGEPD